jgi:hypothetical protein
MLLTLPLFDPSLAALLAIFGKFSRTLSITPLQTLPYFMLKIDFKNFDPFGSLCEWRIANFLWGLALSIRQSLSIRQ